MSMGSGKEMIPIQNIYYMLSYAFQVLTEQGYKKLATESFHNIGELCAAILAKGVAIQVKRGLGRQYLLQTEPVSSLKGRLEIEESIKKQTIIKKQMICSYEEFSVNSIMNRIIKSTMELLLRSDISNIRKKELRKWIIYFSDVEHIDLNTVNWNIQYNRNNQTYRMLISICYFVVKGLLPTKADGSMKLMDFLDEQRMFRLYEKFILEYYRKEFPKISVNASQISWQLDDDNHFMLPIMQTDIMLTYQEKILIIDAKYYSQIMQKRFQHSSIRSGNLYQMFAYVKNKEIELAGKPHEVSGMLLYAKTEEEEIVPKCQYQMSGNKISVCVLDLNCNFEEIKEQLDAIIIEHFGKIE